MYSITQELLNPPKKQEQVKEEGEAVAPANVTGQKVSTDIPVPKKKDIKKYKNMAVRSKPQNVGY